MRGCILAVAVVLAVILLAGRETEGFWFDQDAIQNAIRRAGKWVTDNCQLDGSGVSCNGTHILRRRRSTDTDTDQSAAATLDELCPQFDVGANAKIADVVDTALMEMDGNKDGQLDTDESVRFTELMGVLDYCSK